MAGPPAAAAPVLESLSAGPTPAAKPAADPNKSRAAIRSPSATGGRLDRRKILRRARDVVGAARGLRVGRQSCGRCKQDCDRKGERDFAHRFSPSGAAIYPKCAPSAVDLTRPAVLVHVEDGSVRGGCLHYRSPSCSAPCIDVAASGQSWDGNTIQPPARGRKREAPAVVGPGLSCSSVTTILADRDIPR